MTDQKKETGKGYDDDGNDGHMNSHIAPAVGFLPPSGVNETREPGSYATAPAVWAPDK